MANFCELTTDQRLPIDIETDLGSLEIISKSEFPETCENEISPEMGISQHEEQQVDNVDQADCDVDQTKKVNVLEDIVQIIELVNNSVTKDGSSVKNKYKDGFLFLEDLQTQFENIQKQMAERDSMVVALVIENSTLKGEANKYNDELNKKCKQLDELKEKYKKIKNEVNSHKTKEQGHSKNDQSSIERNSDLKRFQDDVQTSPLKLDHNLSCQHQSQILLGNSKGHHKALLLQQYPNLISKTQNKCSICGMPFSTSVQLKLHGDLAHNHKISLPEEVTISSVVPYQPYCQREMPKATPLQPLQKHYHKRLWSTSQPTRSTTQKRKLTNSLSSSSYQNARKRRTV